MNKGGSPQCILKPGHDRAMVNRNNIKTISEATSEDAKVIHTWTFRACKYHQEVNWAWEEPHFHSSHLPCTSFFGKPFPLSFLGPGDTCIKTISGKLSPACLLQQSILPLLQHGHPFWSRLGKPPTLRLNWVAVAHCSFTVNVKVITNWTTMPTQTFVQLLRMALEHYAATESDTETLIQPLILALGHQRLIVTLRHQFRDW